MYQNSPYRFDDQGGVFSIKLLDGMGGSPVPLTSAKVTGAIDGMTLGAAYDPNPVIPPAVPEPSTFLLFGAGVAGVAFLRRRKLM